VSVLRDFEDFTAHKVRTALRTYAATQHSMSNPLFRLCPLCLFVVAMFAEDVAGTAALQLAPPWQSWTVTDDNVMGGVSSGNVEERSDASLAFAGTVSFDRNGGFSSASSHGGGSYRFVQLFNNRGGSAPVSLHLSRFGKDGGVKVTFSGDNTASEAGPRAVNLNVYETRQRMSFGGFSPSSTSSSFVVYPSSEPQSWFVPFSTFMGSSFTRAAGERGLPLASLSSKLGMQVGSYHFLLRLSSVAPAPPH